MPIYEYVCKNCGKFEYLQGLHDPLLKKCPTCGASVEKIISACSIRFKGSGFYTTDYAIPEKQEKLQRKRG